MRSRFAQPFVDTLLASLAFDTPTAIHRLAARLWEGSESLSTTVILGDATIRPVTVVPEPGTWALMGPGILSLATLW